MSHAAYREQMLVARAADLATAREYWRAGAWHRLAPLVQGWAALGVPMTLGLSGDDVDDLVARTLVKAWTAPAVPDQPAAWCRTVAHHLALDTLKQRPHVTLDEAPELPDPVPDERTSREQIARLRQALRRLDDKLRRCVVLHYLHGQPHGQIAAQLGLTVGACKMRTVRGVRLLARIFAEMPPGRLNARGMPEKPRGRPPKPISWRQLPVRDDDLTTRAKMAFVGLS